MNRFDEIIYEKPDYELLKSQIAAYAKAISAADSLEAFYEAIEGYEKAYKKCDTMGVISLIRCFADGTDEFYSEEMAENQAQDEALDRSAIYEAIEKSPFKNDFEKKYGAFFLGLQKAQAAINANGHEFLEKEHELLAESQKLLTEMRFEFKGEQMSAAQLAPYKDSEDAEERILARRASKQAYADKREEFGTILKNLVVVRNEFAKANGFDNYLEYSNVEKERISYGEKELSEFVENVKKYILPIIEKNNKKIQQRLKLEKYTSDDTGVYFTDGEAKVKGDVEFVKDKVQEMFFDMDEHLGSIFKSMRDNRYFDIEMSDNKVTGIGFTTYIFDEKLPFIFGNYLGNGDSVNTFVHECGHAMQNQLTMERYNLAELCSQVQDMSEVPSKSMELIFHEYAGLVFGDDAKKYVESHLCEYLNEIATYCALHEFETFIYTNPDADIQEMIDRLNELFALYTPGVEYTDMDLRRQGAMLFSNSLLFRFVRYTVSYSLCDLSAIYMASEFKKDKKRGVELFKNLCSIGGSLDYNDAIASLGLKSSFSEEVIKEIADYLEIELGLK